MDIEMDKVNLNFFKKKLHMLAALKMIKNMDMENFISKHLLNMMKANRKKM